MSGPYFQKQPWSPFSYQGTTYDLSHLNEFQFPVQDQRGVVRMIVVTFEDHCFTRDWERGDPAPLIFPGCSRNPGCFDFDRYVCSLGIAERITAAAQGKVHLLKGDNFAVIPAVTLSGATVNYGIVFSLDRVRGLAGIDLHLRVKTAYPFTQKQPTTYGSTRFKVLVDLRMRNKYPGLNTSQHRRW